MTFFAERLQIGRIEKKLLVATMWNDMVNHRGGDYLSFSRVLGTERIFPQLSLASVLPPARVVQRVVFSLPRVFVEGNHGIRISA